MKKTLIFTIACLFALTHAIGGNTQDSQAQSVYSTDLPAYVIYDAQGEKVSFAQMIDELLSADVCLFGELHNDPISHWLELSVAKHLYQNKGQDLVLGAEMFEADNQLLMDEMVLGFIDMDTYVSASVLWPNFTTDYKPLVVFAQSAGLKFVCTNIPRRYANIVYKKGIEYIDSLSSQAQSYLPNLPIHFNLEEKAYKDMAASFPSDEQFEAMKGKMMSGAPQAMMASKPSNLVKAQAIKDATMAHFIVENWEKGKLFYHFHGEFHSANHSGICYYLKYYNPEITYKTISVNKSEDPLEFDAAQSRADFNIVVQGDMTQTYESN